MINFTEPETIEMNEMQYLRFFTGCHFQSGVKSQNTFYKLGNVLYNDPYAYVQERRCENKIVRKVGTGLDRITVISEEGLVWTILLSNFKEVTPLTVIMK